MSAPAMIAPGLRVTVVGDVMLDEYVFGEATRISPEAPVPVVHARGERKTPGGAAHSARCAAALQAQVQLYAVVGADAAGTELERLLADGGVTAQFISSANRDTIRKVRIFAGHHQVARIDHETVAPLDHADERLLIDAIGRAADADVLLVTDYAKGCVTSAVMDQVRAVARARAVPVVVDPKARTGRSTAASMS